MGKNKGGDKLEEVGVKCLGREYSTIEKGGNNEDKNNKGKGKGRHKKWNSHLYPLSNPMSPNNYSHPHIHYNPSVTATSLTPTIPQTPTINSIFPSPKNPMNPMNPMNHMPPMSTPHISQPHNLHFGRPQTNLQVYQNSSKVPDLRLISPDMGDRRGNFHLYRGANQYSNLSTYKDTHQISDEGNNIHNIHNNTEKCGGGLMVRSISQPLEPKFVFKKGIPKNKLFNNTTMKMKLPDDLKLRGAIKMRCPQTERRGADCMELGERKGILIEKTRQERIQTQRTSSISREETNQLVPKLKLFLSKQAKYTIIHKGKSKICGETTIGTINNSKDPTSDSRRRNENIGIYTSHKYTTSKIKLNKIEGACNFHMGSPRSAHSSKNTLIFKGDKGFKSNSKISYDSIICMPEERLRVNNLCHVSKNSVDISDSTRKRGLLIPHCPVKGKDKEGIPQRKNFHIGRKGIKSELSGHREGIMVDIEKETVSACSSPYKPIFTFDSLKNRLDAQTHQYTRYNTQTNVVALTHPPVLNTNTEVVTAVTKEELVQKELGQKELGQKELGQSPTEYNLECLERLVEEVKLVRDNNRMFTDYVSGSQHPNKCRRLLQFGEKDENRNLNEKENVGIENMNIIEVNNRLEDNNISSDNISSPPKAKPMFKKKNSLQLELDNLFEDIKDLGIIHPHSNIPNSTTSHGDGESAAHKLQFNLSPRDITKRLFLLKNEGGTNINLNINLNNKNKILNVGGSNKQHLINTLKLELGKSTTTLSKSSTHNILPAHSSALECAEKIINSVLVSSKNKGIGGIEVGEESSKDGQDGKSCIPESDELRNLPQDNPLLLTKTQTPSNKMVMKEHESKSSKNVSNYLIHEDLVTNAGIINIKERKSISEELEPSYTTQTISFSENITSGELIHKFGVERDENIALFPRLNAISLFEILRLAHHPNYFKLDKPQLEVFKFYSIHTKPKKYI